MIRTAATGKSASRAVAPAGDVYVADSLHERLQRFSPRGDPISVAVDPAGNVYVADHAATFLEAGPGGRVQEFDPDGNFVTEWHDAPALPARPKLLARQAHRTARGTGGRGA